jgi:hypothetical protein
MSEDEFKPPWSQLVSNIDCTWKMCFLYCISSKKEINSVSKVILFCIDYFIKMDELLFLINYVNFDIFCIIMFSAFWSLSLSEGRRHCYCTFSWTAVPFLQDFCHFAVGIIYEASFKNTV